MSIVAWPRPAKAKPRRRPNWHWPARARRPCSIGSAARAAEGRPGEESFRVGPGPGAGRRGAAAAGKPDGLVVHPAAGRQRATGRGPERPGGGRRRRRRQRPTPRPRPLFRDAPVGLALADDDGMLVETNAAFDSFFGIAGRAIGRSLTELVDQGDRQAVERPCRRRARRGQRNGRRTGRSAPARPLRPDGRTLRAAPPMAAARR